MVDCITALEDTQALALFTDHAVVYDTIELNTKAEIAAYYVAVCEVVQALTTVIGGSEPGFFHFETFVNAEEDFGLECDKGVAFDFATGEVVVEIESLGVEIVLPVRETDGMVKDGSKAFGWAVSHLHRSVNLETIIDLALLAAGFGKTNKHNADNYISGDIADFNKIIQKPGLSKSAADSCNLHLAKYFW
jgi:hypothetical protein